MRITLIMLAVALMGSSACCAAHRSSLPPEIAALDESDARFPWTGGAGVGGMGFPGTASAQDLDRCSEDVIRAFDPGPGELQALGLRTELAITTSPEDTHGQETVCESDETDDACLLRAEAQARLARPGWIPVFSNVRHQGERLLDAALLVDGERQEVTVYGAEALATMVGWHEQEGREVSVLSTVMRRVDAQRTAYLIVRNPDAEPRQHIRRTMSYRWWPEIEGASALEHARERAAASGLSLREATAEDEGGHVLVVTCP
jgi:hypothetical protein